MKKIFTENGSVDKCHPDWDKGSGFHCISLSLFLTCYIGEKTSVSLIAVQPMATISREEICQRKYKLNCVMLSPLVP